MSKLVPVRHNKCNAARQWIDYIIKSLQDGKPVIVGVNYKFTPY